MFWPIARRRAGWNKTGGSLKSIDLAAKKNTGTAKKMLEYSSYLPRLGGIHPMAIYKVRVFQRNCAGSVPPSRARHGTAVVGNDDQRPQCRSGWIRYIDYSSNNIKWRSCTWERQTTQGTSIGPHTESLLRLHQTTHSSRNNPHFGKNLNTSSNPGILSCPPPCDPSQVLTNKLPAQRRRWANTSNPSSQPYSTKSMGMPSGGTSCWILSYRSLSKAPASWS